MGLMKAGYDTYGEVFTVPVLHKKITFLIGPHVSAHFYKASDDDMSQKEVFLTLSRAGQMPYQQRPPANPLLTQLPVRLHAAMSAGSSGLLHPHAAFVGRLLAISRSLLWSSAIPDSIIRDVARYFHRHWG